MMHDNTARTQFIVGNNSSTILQNKENTQLKLISKINSPYKLLENYYSTTLAGYNSWVTANAPKYPQLNPNYHDEIMFSTTNCILTWSRQTGYTSKSKHSPSVPPTCIDISQWGAHITGYSRPSRLIAVRPGNLASTIENIPHTPTSGSYEPMDDATPTAVVFLTPKVVNDKLKFMFLVADDYGRVMKVDITGNGLVIVDCISISPDCFICSLQLSRDEKFFVASTVKGYTVSVVKIDPKLELVDTFKHRSAIKALSFCPATNRLLATGGGRKDRLLKFTNVSNGDVIFQMEMPGQVVGLVWLSNWEVFVAIGHSRVDNYAGLGKIVNVATHKCICDVPGETFALSAVKTLEGFCVSMSNRQIICFSWTSNTDHIRVDEVLVPLFAKPIPQLR